MCAVRDAQAARLLHDLLLVWMPTMCLPSHRTAFTSRDIPSYITGGGPPRRHETDRRITTLQYITRLHMTHHTSYCIPFRCTLHHRATSSRCNVRCNVLCNVPSYTGPPRRDGPRRARRALLRPDGAQGDVRCNVLSTVMYCGQTALKVMYDVAYLVL